MISVAVLRVSVVRCVSRWASAWLIFRWWRRSLVISVCSLYPSKHPWGKSLGGYRSQRYHGYLRALLKACGSRLVARPGITTLFNRHHPQAHLLVMSLILFIVVMHKFSIHCTSTKLS